MKTPIKTRVVSFRGTGGSVRAPSFHRMVMAMSIPYSVARGAIRGCQGSIL
jgi:hypothetical protein